MDIDMYNLSFFVIGFGLMGLGAWVWSPAIFLGAFFLLFVALWVKIESFSHLRRKD
jgi:hypothetical protein